MFKKLILFFLSAIIITNTTGYAYYKNEGPSDETQKEIDNLNNTIAWRSTVFESEGLYYYDIRKLLKSANIMWDIYDESMKDPEYIAWQEEYRYKDRPNHRRIVAKDLTIPAYTGSGPRLSTEEYKIATDFSKDYICKSFGDLVADLWSDERERLNYYQNAGLINGDEVYNCLKTGACGARIYIGSDELKNVLMTMPLFNKDKLELNESGFYTNYKKFVK